MFIPLDDFYMVQLVLILCFIYSFIVTSRPPVNFLVLLDLGRLVVHTHSLEMFPIATHRNSVRKVRIYYLLMCWCLKNISQKNNSVYYFVFAKFRL